MCNYFKKSVMAVFIMTALLLTSCIQTYQDSGSREDDDYPHHRGHHRGEEMSPMDPQNLEDYLYERHYMRRIGTRNIYDNRFSGHSIRCGDVEMGLWGNKVRCCGIDRHGNCIPGSDFIIGERVFDPDRRVKEYRP